jgi:hypothetical protein
MPTIKLNTTHAPVLSTKVSSDELLHQKEEIKLTTKTVIKR